MKRVLSSVLVLAAGLALTSPCLRAEELQPVQAAAACDVTGTWYGGGEVVKYLMTIIPDERAYIFNQGRSISYTLFFHASSSLAGMGFPVGTPASGSIIKRYSKSGWTIDAYAIAMPNHQEFGPTPDIFAVHATGQMTDCNSLTLNYDFFGGYLWTSNKIPFTDAPDYVPVPPPFTETYKRMPTKCAQCGQ